MNKNRIVGTCNYCEDPIYAFQLVKNEMHVGCAEPQKIETKGRKRKGKRYD